MKNIGNLMKQVQDMQARMEEATERLSDAEIPGSSGGGMVTVVVNGPRRRPQGDDRSGAARRRGMQA